MRISAHACLLDKDCRKDGAPGHVYLFVGRRVIRFSPPYSRNPLTVYFHDGHRWTWRVVKTWRRGT